MMDPETITLLRNAAGALDALLCQISQMEGMFDDEDGTIAEAVESGEDALAEIHHALREARQNG